MSGIYINDNLAATQAYNNLSSTSDMLSTAVGKLSSGLSIQSASDNPAGFVQAQLLQVESNGYGQALSNAQDAVSVLQTAQGALNQEASILQAMNTLATSAASGGSNSTGSTSADQAQFASLQNELDQISGSTTFGGTQVLDGTFTNQTFQIGAYNTTSDQITVSISSTDAASLGIGTAAVSIGNATAAAAAMSAVQAAITTLAGQAASLGATQNQIQAISANLTTAQQNIQAAHASLVDVNVAQESAAFTSDQILEQSGVAILAQANQLPSLALKLIGG